MSQHPEVKVSEADPAETQQVVDALVSEWKHFSKPRRDDGQPFRREDIAVQKVSIPDVAYPIYVCVPRDIRGGSGIDVDVSNELVSLAAPYLDKNSFPMKYSFASVLLNNGMPLAAVKSISPHEYITGWELFVATPDIDGLPNVLYSKQVGDYLNGRPIEAMTVTCGFSRSDRNWKANIAVFTNPIVK